MIHEDALIERLVAASQQIYAATKRGNSEVLMHPDIAQKLIEDGVLPPFKTPLQDFVERACSDD